VSEVVEAVYEKGILRPIKPVKLREGQKVKLIIEEDFIEASFGKVKSKVPLEVLEEAYHDYLLERASAR
jgi:predicted DNA-binding antitoxin AbrB/MazE fold protein